MEKTVFHKLESNKGQLQEENKLIVKVRKRNDSYRSLLGVVTSLISRKWAVRHQTGLKETGFPFVKHTLRAGFVLLTMHILF